MEGTGSLNQTTDNPAAQLIPLVPDSWKIVNIAAAGEELSEMNPQFETQALPLYSTGYARNIFVVSGGTNDVNHGTRTLAQMKSDMQTLVNKAKAAGFFVIAGDIEANGSEAQLLTDYNIWFNSPALTGVDVKISWRSNPKLATPSDHYYFDETRVHHTRLGYGVKSLMIKAAIDKLPVNNGAGTKVAEYPITVESVDARGNVGIRVYTFSVAPKGTWKRLKQNQGR